jgi:hypothetical protein
MPTALVVRRVAHLVGWYAITYLCDRPHWDRSALRARRDRGRRACRRWPIIDAVSHGRGTRPERNHGHQDEPSPDDQAGRGKAARRRGRGSRARHIRRPRRACADAGSCTRAGGDAGRRAGRSAGAVVAQPLFQVAERLPPTSVRGQRPDPPWPCLKRSSCAGSCCGGPHSPAAPVGDALDRCRYRDTFRNVWPYATCGCKLVR